MPVGNHNYSLLTDLYQLTMAQGYWECNKLEEEACFHAFFRTNPFHGGYAIACGTDHVLEVIEDYRFTSDDIAYLASLEAPGGGALFDPAFLDYLSTMELSVDIDAVREGTVVFPNDPLLRVTGPILQCQLLETALLNCVNFETLIATKAARVCLAADSPVAEFGLRRAQGEDGGLRASRAAVVGGCASTSNVLAGKLFNIPVSGTHAHSWVMSFDNELEAFREYARVMPKNCVLLVDTYDTLKSGIPNAIRVFTEMRDAGIPLTYYGIRMDSGDLAYLSKQVRKMLDEAGFPDAVISASNDLDEYLIESLKLQGAAISSWGVGTNLIPSKDNPAFGGVYKLAAIRTADGSFQPKIKLSENVEKVTNPGNKTFYRVYDKKTGKIKADLICLYDETFDESEDLKLFDPNAPWKKTRLPGGSYTLREMLIPVIKAGKTVYTSPGVMEIREICNHEKDTIWDETKRFVNPQEIYVDLSQKLYDMKTALLNEMSMDS